MDIEKINEFARGCGFDYARPYPFKWMEYEVYQLDFDVPEGSPVPCVGMPYVLLVNGDNIRMSTFDELIAFCDYCGKVHPEIFPEIEDDDVDDDGVFHDDADDEE